MKMPWMRVREPEDPGRKLLAALGADEFVPLAGMYVYGLVGPDGKVFYVGKSASIMRRLHEHQQAYGSQLVSVLLARVATDWSMTVTEDFLIDRLQPPVNVHGMADETGRIRERLARRSLRGREMQLARAEARAVAGDDQAG